MRLRAVRCAGLSSAPAGRLRGSRRVRPTARRLPGPRRSGAGLSTSGELRAIRGSRSERSAASLSAALRLSPAGAESAAGRDRPERVWGMGVSADGIRPEGAGWLLFPGGRCRRVVPCGGIRRDPAAGGAAGPAAAAVGRAGRGRFPAGRVHASAERLPDRPGLHGALATIPVVRPGDCRETRRSTRCRSARVGRRGGVGDGGSGRKPQERGGE